MKKIVLLAGCLCVAVTVAAQGESFESPVYQAGQSLGEEGSWFSTEVNGVVVTEDEAASGTQSLKISEGSMVQTVTHPGGVTFYQFYILPSFEETATQPMVNVAGAEFSFLKTSDAFGGVAVYANPARPSVLIRSTIALASEANSSEAWVLVTVRVDGPGKTWDLYLDGIPVAANLSLSKVTGTVSIKGTGVPTFFDEYLEINENPLFADTDRDGIPDAEEKAFGLNAFGDDRSGDLDNDGVSNADEFFAGTSPNANAHSHGHGNAILYVDNLYGSDVNSGTYSYSTRGSDGPKGSLKSAMAAAPSTATIVVLPGKGLYREGSRGVEDKKLTIQTLGPVTIQ